MKKSTRADDTALVDSFKAGGWAQGSQDRAGFGRADRLECLPKI